ncbi:MAG: CSLREA domain-containing protein [Myxococcaceae bacterium]|nr:CSLREA domain-containing protein [Myxococcaceae bacterium]
MYGGGNDEVERETALVGVGALASGMCLVRLTAGAAQIAVNTVDDELNPDGDCSLRAAVQAANTDTAVDAGPAGSGADVITSEAIRTAAAERVRSPLRMHPRHRGGRSHCGASSEAIRIAAAEHDAVAAVRIHPRHRSGRSHCAASPPARNAPRRRSLIGAERTVHPPPLPVPRHRGAACAPVGRRGSSRAILQANRLIPPRPPVRWRRPGLPTTTDAWVRNDKARA